MDEGTRQMLSGAKMEIRELKSAAAALEKENARLLDALNHETYKYLRLISAIDIGMKDGKRIKIVGKVKA